MSEDRPATIDDFRKIGAEHGRNAAECILAALKAGVPDWAVAEFHRKTIMPSKECELRELGASEDEITAYINASQEMSTKLLSAVGFFAEMESTLPVRRKR